MFRSADVCESESSSVPDGMLLLVVVVVLPIELCKNGMESVEKRELFV